MTYYIATKLENHVAHNVLRDALTRRGHHCTYDWTSHGAVWEQGLAVCERVAHLEADGVENADVVIMLWPGGRGTHVELGMAIALGKRVVLVTDVDGHHRACPDVCAFYHHRSVERYRTIADWLTEFDQEPSDPVLAGLQIH